MAVELKTIINLDKYEEARRRLGLKKYQVAERIGKHPTYLDALIRGKYPWGAQVMAKLAEALGVKVKDLFRTKQVKI